MTREFIIMPEFEKQWKAMNLNDEHLKILQEQLTISPKCGDVIQGTGGLRKIRFAFDNAGKSGSVRVCYVDVEDYRVIYLITAFQKNQKENLTLAERNTLKNLVKILKQQIIEGRKRQ